MYFIGALCPFYSSLFCISHEVEDMSDYVMGITLLQEMNAPSFRVEKTNDGRMLLHYYSDRKGLYHIVPGEKQHQSPYPFLKITTTAMNCHLLELTFHSSYIFIFFNLCRHYRGGS